MEIRLAGPEDLAEVGSLTGEAYLGDGFVTADDEYLLVLGDAARRAADAELWVAVEDGRVVGTVTFCPPESTYREIAWADEGEFRMLAVSTEARGRGVGKALVEHCVQRSRDLGLAGVRMSTMDRMTSAHRVYERLGFVRAAEDDWEPVPGVKLLAYALAF